jgi:hypothetical protein
VAGATSRWITRAIELIEGEKTMAWKIYDETVEMVQRRFQYFPRVFHWRGRRYQVQMVERCWTVSRRGWKRRVERHFFQVRCSEGDFELYQEIRTGIWHLRRARMAPVPGSATRRFAPAWR